MHQAWSTILLPPYLFLQGWLFCIRHYPLSMHHHHNPVDNRDDCDERRPMRVPFLYALGRCVAIHWVLHLRIPFCDGLCNIKLLAWPFDPCATYTQGSNRSSRIIKYIADVPQIWSLHAVTARKIGVTGVFGLAIMSVTNSIYLRPLLYSTLLRLTLYQRPGS